MLKLYGFLSSAFFLPHSLWKFFFVYCEIYFTTDIDVSQEPLSATFFKPQDTILSIKLFTSNIILHPMFHFPPSQAQSLIFPLQSCYMFSFLESWHVCITMGLKPASQILLRIQMLLLLDLLFINKTTCPS